MNRRSMLVLGAAGALLAPRLARSQDAPVCERIVARVGSNHRHAFEVAVADVTAGVEKTYDLAGEAGHSHKVTLGPADFERVRAGAVVRMPTTREGGHIHRVLVRCAPAVDPPEARNACEIEIGGKDDHELIITEADVQAKVERTYEIQGIAPHLHQVTLTAADFEKLLAGKQAVLASTTGDGHAHRVYVRYPRKK
jgi:hypothetical protein